MDISSEEARLLQFSGTEYSYDGGEVEEFRRRVVAALARYEASRAVPGGAAVVASADDEEADLTAAQRIRHQAVQMAERMLREVMGSSDDGRGLETWQDAAILRALAEEEMEHAREEARRLPAQAAAERDEMRATYKRERLEIRAELQRELESSRAAAGEEAGNIRASAEAEATALLQRAMQKAEDEQHKAAKELQRIEQRLDVLRTVLADAESRFRRLASMAANEIGTLEALSDQDVPAPESSVRLASVDLTAPEGDGLEESAAEPVESNRFVRRDSEVGFYQRRLAGLRDRLEKSGNQPE